MIKNRSDSFFSRLVPKNCFFISRIHFLIQVLISQILYCALFIATSQAQLKTAPDGCLLFFALGSFGISFTLLIEFLSRKPSERSLSGIGKGRKSAICYRQILFLMTTILASLIFLDEHAVSRLLLPLFAGIASLWLIWSNLVGYRMLHRKLYRGAHRIGGTDEGESPTFPVAL
ncbi:MAG: hypothetical protein P1U86_10995 [Verrucomicrobiales bacterium]|nr:hypothetical protein [Verrucomicrobiales bacterium]